MTKTLNACPFCKGHCRLVTQAGQPKKYFVLCQHCGHQSDLTGSKAAATQRHNHTRIISSKNLLTGAPDA